MTSIQQSVLVSPQWSKEVHRTSVHTSQSLCSEESGVTRSKPSDMPPKRKVLTLKEKMDVIIKFDKEKLNVRDLAKCFGIGKTQAAAIIKNKNLLLSKFNSNINVNEKRSFLKEEGRMIDKLCYEWFIMARSKNIPLSGTLVRTKAKEIADGLGHKNFSASAGWLEKFRIRHNITFRAVSGKAVSANSPGVATFLMKLPVIINHYSPKNVFNADASGLFFRALPNKTLHLKDEKCIGGKLANERLTILFCVNMEGEKEKLLVIGKAAKSFKRININDLPCTWRCNEKAWITGELMAEWLLQFDRKMIHEKRKILLLLNSACSCSRDIKLQNIELISLPPDCTSVVQPLEQGIIRSFKAFYKTFLIIKQVVNAVQSTSELAQEINVLDAMYLIKTAWDRVSKNTIINCFIQSGFSHLNNSEYKYENSDNESGLPLSVLAGILRNKENLGIKNDGEIGEFFNLDNNLIYEETNESACPEGGTQEDESDDECSKEEKE